MIFKKSIRISKFLSCVGICSRRDAEKLIEEGRVICNGYVINTILTFIIPGLDVVLVDGQLIKRFHPFTRLWICYKPKGLLTTNLDDRGRLIIFNFFPKFFPRLISVGRLDLESEGLLLLTNNGRLARFLEHPENGIEKIYKVNVFFSSKFKKECLNELNKNLSIKGLRYNVKFNVKKAIGVNIHFNFILKEGKNKEIRKIIQYFGGRVQKLIRTDYGPFSLSNLKEGSIKEIFLLDVLYFCRTIGFY